jgi:hypothetical protein
MWYNSLCRYAVVLYSQTDVYALAMLAYELWSEEPPWKGQSGAKIAELVLAHRRPAMPPEVPSDVQRLIEECWHGSAGCRPTAEEVVLRLDVVVASLPHAEITHTTTSVPLRQPPPFLFVDRAYFQRNRPLFPSVDVDGVRMSVAEWRCGAGVFAAARVSCDGAAGVELLARTVLSCIEDSSADNCDALRCGLVVHSVEIAVTSDMKRDAFLEKVRGRTLSLRY